MFLPLLRGLGELLGPTRCPGCDLVSPTPEDAFCPACRPLLEPAPAALLPPQQAAAAFVFEGPLADAIRRFKYAGRSELARPLGQLLAQAAAPYAALQMTLVAPMPLHPRKLRARGFNPAALLGRELASALSLPLACDVLRRGRDTPPQASLARADRAANVLGAFSARQALRKHEHVLLIDDVRTTGATSSEAARALHAAGYEVRTLALAWSPA